MHLGCNMPNHPPTCPLTWDNLQVISMPFCHMEQFISLHLIYLWFNLLPDFHLNLGKVGFEGLEHIFNPSKCVIVES